MEKFGGGRPERETTPWFGLATILPPSAQVIGLPRGRDDVAFSSIDLWKGCVALVPAAFDGALVTKEFPIYEITNQRLLPEFVQTLLRTRYYQRAFRAITTGHSNRRRTQIADFEAIELAFPPEPEEQRRLIAGITQASGGIRAADEALRRELHAFSSVIDGGGGEELPETTDD